jgi:uncharacterized membrane protein YphA (DoxX/SURF4 family)
MSTDRKRSRIALWIIQGVLAALFLFAGWMKLATPMADLARMSPLSPEFLKFIGACEVLGALGLILPGLFRVRLGLTPLAAAGLVIIMIGAVIVSIVTHQAAAAGVPLIVGVLSTVVALGRRAPSPRTAS